MTEPSPKRKWLYRWAALLCLPLLLSLKSFPEDWLKQDGTWQKKTIWGVELRPNQDPGGFSTNGVWWLEMKQKLEILVFDRTAELERANQELQRLANIDPLTGLANRKRFDEVLDQEWRRATRSGTPLSLIVIDVDLFKEYNDRYGHPEGDRCLAMIAGLLGQCATRRQLSGTCRAAGKPRFSPKPLADPRIERHHR